MNINMNEMPDPTIMFENRINGMTYCPFGNFCIEAINCDKVVTQELVDEANRLEVAIVQFVSPPVKCFKNNGKM